MRLIGMMDSPYVRRLAVSLRLLDLPFTHEPLSVFRDFEAFARVNPVVKAPTLVTDEGVVLMDSTLILEYVERLVAPGLRLAPEDLGAYAQAQKVIGLALAAAEKAVQIVYERMLRPEAIRHQPWIDRVQGQMAQALALLEAEIGPQGAWLFGERPLQADITTAVVWRFVREMLPEAPPEADTPKLTALSARAEALPAFRACPFS
ncbi:glutathione S-transferase family protein [Rhodospirillum rubrum]|uniref:Glutathione S-transferase-like n=1 Tax=Rhodospirillum rubrum (strain ATCC 11170 / ATH 1.1.1 / DSM 467 / LMG 4362 / NCIMB 8255 / S1) TaxID=269796 RepID=Q2RVQ7_RHORT|nr:glutathione S-transferase [Rhodospirillum rubrum]ABC21788.1 Glutathione S-transferase-like [Rhodospirillum rubrum ATCC 11170]AEO47488.1 glutathione S-transferase-like protein [Rhodospirillum rubrum F11]MBK5953346.1 glutathione S-transferase [Rhodospirillum rubrum]QXG81452.1 glutathione S-transferase [Rhodospirillum rubrum]HCF17262.1 glutathione S-transferase [Rhodospirillum rubrum]